MKSFKYILITTLIILNISCSENNNENLLQENRIIGNWIPLRSVAECPDSGEIDYFNLDVQNQRVYKITFKSDGTYYEYDSLGNVITNTITWSITENKINFIVDNPIGSNSFNVTNELFLLTDNNLGFGLRQNPSYCENLKFYTEYSRE
jgi:hypothetical protein